MSQARNTLVRPLTARSVIASTLLGINPPRLSAAALVASGEQYGVAAGTTRVALSRMVEAGELVAVDASYELAGALLERHARQEQGRHPRTKPWTGDWRIALVRASTRQARERAALRTAMGQLRMAELREGVWLRPDNLPTDRSQAAGVADAQCEWFTGKPERDVDVAALFGLGAWGDVARELLAELAATAPRLAARDADALAETFVVAAAATRHLTLDPLLPDPLLPDDWPGDALRTAYDAYQRDFAATWRQWFTSKQ
jgi:phenylacetic acid degradation operon negative regulatory protein